jgi:hypothetical protein
MNERAMLGWTIAGAAAVAAVSITDGNNSTNNSTK